MVGVMSSIPSGGNFIFADFETPRCQFCTKMPEMSDMCYLGKTRLQRNTEHRGMDISLDITDVINFFLTHFLMNSK